MHTQWCIHESYTMQVLLYGTIEEWVGKSLYYEHVNKIETNCRIANGKTQSTRPTKLMWKCGYT